MDVQMCARLVGGYIRGSRSFENQRPARSIDKKTIDKFSYNISQFAVPQFLMIYKNIKFPVGLFCGMHILSGPISTANTAMLK
jgi:hypothetical protein